MDGHPLFRLMELAVPQELIATATRRRAATTNSTFLFIAQFIFKWSVNNNGVDAGITDQWWFLNTPEQFERSLDEGAGLP